MATESGSLESPVGWTKCLGYDAIARFYRFSGTDPMPTNETAALQNYLKGKGHEH